MKRTIWLHRLSALIIATAYGIFGILWILLSDRIVQGFTQNPDLITKIQTYKGWLYVLLSAALIYGLIRIYHRYLQGKERESKSELIQKLKEQSEELEIAHRKILDQQTSSALIDLMVGLSHELNTPIGNALTAVTSLKDVIPHATTNAEGETAPQSLLTHELLDVIEESIQRTVNLMEGFEKYSLKSLSTHGQEVKVVETVKGILTSLNRNYLPMDVNLQFAAEDEFSMKIDVEAFQIVLQQLFENSMMHGFDMRKPSSEDKKEDEPTIMVSIYKRTEDIQIHYSDNGTENTDIEAGRIFEPFYTSKREAGRPGLGLSIAKRIIEKTFGGSIHCESGPEGLMFVISLPKN